MVLSREIRALGVWGPPSSVGLRGEGFVIGGIPFSQKGSPNKGRVTAGCIAI